MSPTFKKAISYGAYPLLVAWPLVGSLTVVGAVTFSASPLLRQGQELALFLFITVPQLLALVFLERTLPAQPEQKPSTVDRRCDVINLAMCCTVVSPIAQQMVKLLALGAAGTIAAVAGTHLWPTHWPTIAQVILALVISELGTYWLHRTSHRPNLLWRLHATHHGTPQAYWLNSTRFHALELTLRTMCQVGPLIVLGCPHETFLVFGIFTINHGWVQHSNVAYRSGLLDFIFASPKNHRWHHSTNPVEANRNYGVVTTLWDHVFGTFFSPRDRVFTGQMGIGDLPNFPTTYLGQLLSPFRWERLLRSQPSTAAAPSADALVERERLTTQGTIA